MFIIQTSRMHVKVNFFQVSVSAIEVRVEMQYLFIFF
jgi:hypothetical protein